MIARWKQPIIALLLCGTGLASQRIVDTGDATFDSDTSIYYFAHSRYDQPHLSFIDPNGILDTVSELDGLTLTLDFAPPNSPTGLPHFVVLNITTPGSSPAQNPALFAGQDNGLYPSFDEPLFANTGVSSGGGGSTPTDSDGDGVPDSSDAFPNDPDETTDTDGDLIGNNADPDDENDGIPDDYELANGLNPLVDDADLDADGDGQSNSHEYIAGTLAGDATSRFELRPDPATPGGFRFQAVAGRTYSLFGSPDADGFQQFGSSMSAESNQIIAVPRPQNRDEFFFKLQVELTNP